MTIYKETESKFNEFFWTCEKKLRSDLNINFDELQKNGNLENMREYSKKLSMISEKYRHSLRTVKSIKKLANEMNMSVNFVEIFKIVALLHDLGRFNQVLSNCSFLDIYNNHSEIGAEMLKNGGFDYFLIDENIRPLLYDCIKKHNDSTNTREYQFHMDSNFVYCDPLKVLTGSYTFNDFEKKIISVTLQLLRDVDKVDHLIERKKGEVAPYETNMKVKNMGLEKTAQYWGVRKSDIKAVNSTCDLCKNLYINIPRNRIPTEKLVIPEEIKTRIFNLEKIDLNVIKSRDDYNFLMALVTEIYSILSNLNFLANYKLLKEDHVLDDIYLLYLPEYKAIIKEYINFYNEYIHALANDTKKELYLKNLS